LARRLRALGYTTFEQYLAHLESNDEAEWETFVNSLTTNLTSFFREAHHFDILVAPSARALKQRPIRIWCSRPPPAKNPIPWR
jgi:chemotaxis protein methyltransferase CheR